MAKTRAEIQKAYRQRKKEKEGTAYLKKEVERVKKYYVPTQDLSLRKLKKRRRMIRESMKKCRQKQKKCMGSDTEVDGGVSMKESSRIILTDEQGPCDSTSDLVAPVIQCNNSSTAKLKVKMKFKRRRRSEALVKAKKRVSDLQERLDKVRKKNDRLRKQVSRQKRLSSQKGTPVSSEAILTETLTPRSKSKADIRRVGLSPSRCKPLVKKLTYHNCLEEEMKATVKSSRKKHGQRSALQVFCGRITEKYKLQRTLNKSLAVDRRQIRKIVKGNDRRKKRLELVRQAVKERVVSFMEREDNSACLPGKKDSTKVDGEQKQTRVLSDYLFNLHMKFLSENNDLKISLSVFGRMRPKNFQLVKFSSRRTCLCQRHQNMALKVKALKAVGVTTTNNPDTLITQQTDEEVLTKIEGVSEQKIKYTEWKRVDVEYKGNTSKRMQIVAVEQDKMAFVEIMRKELVDFRNHNFRVKRQYEEIRNLKEKLPQDQAICQMDFAENYSCVHADEVQSAYFDKASVTLHPVVIYNKDKDNVLQHTSCVYVSDTSSHNAATVYAIMKKVVVEVQNIVPNVKMIHYITDSPTSQYRNKHIIHLVATHEIIFNGPKASWQYFEAGHGKGPCDGVGGTAKRLADLAVKRQTAVIQTALDFYTWGTQQTGSLKYLYVPESKCREAQEELTSMKPKPIKGTMDIHAVIPLPGSRIAVRSTSCFCVNCYNDGVMQPACDGWTEHGPMTTNTYDNVTTTANTSTGGPLAVATANKDVTTSNTDGPMVVPATTNNNGTTTTNTSVTVTTNVGNARATNNPNITEPYPEGSYVAALYDAKWYVGKVIEYDPDDEEYHVSFMTEGSNKKSYTFRWPDKPDQIWLQQTSILCAVKEPMLHGKTRKMYKLDQCDLIKILSIF